MLDEVERVSRSKSREIVLQDKKWVSANFKETQLAEIKLGQPVAIKIDAFFERLRGIFLSYFRIAANVRRVRFNPRRLSFPD